MNASPLVAALLARIHLLHRRLRLLGAGSGAGAASAARLGEGRWEFAGHRRYGPGDDLRALDWKASARRGRAYVRRYAAERIPRLRVVADGSASMSIGAPAKRDRAREAAAVAGGLVLLGGGEARLDRGGGSRPVVHRGPREVDPWVHACLDAVFPEDPFASLDGPAGRSRPGEAILILSDLFLPRDPVPSLARLAVTRRDVWVLHLLAEEDRTPEAVGWRRLRDVETGEERTVRADRTRVAEVSAAVEAWCVRLAEGASHHGYAYHVTGTRTARDDVLLRLLSGAGRDARHVPSGRPG